MNGNDQMAALFLIMTLGSRIIVACYVHYSYMHHFFEYWRAKENMRAGSKAKEAKEAKEYFETHFGEISGKTKRYVIIALYFFGIAHMVPRILSNEIRATSWQQMKRNFPIFHTRTQVLFTLLNRFPLIIYYPYAILGSKSGFEQNVQSYSWLVIIFWTSLIFHQNAVLKNSLNHQKLSIKHKLMEIFLLFLYFLYNFFSLLLSATILASLMYCSMEVGEGMIPLFIIGSLPLVFLRILDPRYFVTSYLRHKFIYFMLWLIILIVPNLCLYYVYETMSPLKANCSVYSNPSSSYLSSYLIFDILSDGIIISFVPSIAISVVLIFELVLFIPDKVKWMFKRIRFGCVFASVVMIADVVSDIETGIEHKENNDYSWSSLSFLFVGLPMVVNCLIGLRRYKHLRFFYLKKGQSSLIFIMHLLGQAQLTWMWDEFFCHFFNYNDGLGGSIKVRSKQVNLIALSTLVLEDIPQACLQIYIVFLKGDQTISFWQTMSIFTSLFSAATTIALKGNFFIENYFNIKLNDVEQAEEVLYVPKIDTKKPSLFVHYEKEGEKMKKKVVKTFSLSYEREADPSSSEEGCCHNFRHKVMNFFHSFWPFKSHRIMSVSYCYTFGPVLVALERNIFC